MGIGRIVHSLLCWALISAALVGAEATAAIYCIKSNADLLAAYEDMQIVAGNPMAPATNTKGFDVRFVTGTFLPPPLWQGGPSLYLNQNFGGSGTYRISGGWSAANNCATQTRGILSPHRTTLVSANGTLLQFAVAATWWTPAPNQEPIIVKVDNLHLAGAAQAILAYKEPPTNHSPNHYPYALHVDAVTIESGGRGISVGGHHGLRVTNSLFRLLSVGSNGDVIRWSGADGRAEIYNNTFRDITGSGQYAATVGTAGSELALGSVVRNNVFHDTPGMRDALNLANTALIFSNNRSTGSTYGNLISLNNVSLDPQFMGTDDSRLHPDSPLRDLGATVSAVTVALGSQDRAGHPRVVNGLLDLGAFEVQSLPQLPDALFGNGFD